MESNELNTNKKECVIAQQANCNPNRDKMIKNYVAQLASGYRLDSSQLVEIEQITK